MPSSVTRTAQTTDKAVLRRSMLALRAAQPAAIAAQCAAYAQAALMAHDIWEQARVVALYMPVKGEIDTHLLRKNAWERGITVLLPRCTAEHGMDFVACTGLQNIVQGAFGIPAPLPNVPAWNADAPDIIVLPGVAYDKRGYRLGFGGGYYDRALAQPHLQTSKRVGLAFSWQVVDTLPVDTWDTLVHCLCTEDGLIWL